MWYFFWILLPVAVVLWLLYEWYEHAVVQYVTTEVECQKLPKDIELKLCLISDLHNNQKNLEELRKHICSFTPEMILLAGDLVDKHKKKNHHAEQFLAALSEQAIPIYYSAGNHELSLSEEEPQAWNRYLANLPERVCFLENKAMCFDASKGILVSGLSLPKSFYQKGKLYENLEELPELSIPEECFHIMMAHNPEYAEMYGKYHADFIVSGHLHGGLLRLPLVGGLVSPRLRLPNGCDAGLVTLSGGNQMFVSRGLGSHTIPLRFFNRVEVNFLVLKGTKE